jgi:hypothetical protein
MEPKKKIRILWLFVSILILLNATTIATILVKRAQATTLKEVSSRNDKSGFTGNKHFFAYYLRFDKEQSELLDIINDGINSDMKEIGSKMKDLKIKMTKQIAIDENDSIKLDAIYDEILLIHSSIYEKNREYYMNIRSICNPNQADRLTTFFSKSIDLKWAEQMK